MALTAQQIAENPALRAGVRDQARSLLAAYEADPRLGAVFATQQRWLMAHAGLSLALRRDEPGRPIQTTASRILDLVARHKIASRNTADAFLKELLHYKIIVHVAAAADKRAHPMALAETTLRTLDAWLAVHLKTLDGLDGGERCRVYFGTPEAVCLMQPRIADGLLSTFEVREPARTFSLFTWLNSGGVVMEWLFAGIEPDAAGAERIPTGVLSIAEFAAFLKLSRTHLDRKLHEAERLGSIGWMGRRGQSVMWVSKAFLEEYLNAQAVKLAIFDQAFDACFATASA